MNETSGISPKVVAGGLAGAVTILLVWVASLFGLEIPPEVASAITTIISGIAAYKAPPGMLKSQEASDAGLPDPPADA